MSSKERKAEMKAQLEEAWRLQDIEDRRRASRSLYEQIVEVETIEDVRDVLHRFADMLEAIQQPAPSVALVRS